MMQSAEDLKTKILMNSVEGRWSVLGWGALRTELSVKHYKGEWNSQYLEFQRYKIRIKKYLMINSMTK